tara:strand:+ start:332 stop:472 length:141 start_codon:yes stop_codon:yes gene_type:complete
MPDRELNIKKQQLVHNDQEITPEEELQIKQYEQEDHDKRIYGTHLC